MVKRQVSNWPLFWLLKPQDQAKLMQLYYDISGEKLDIPPYPNVSKGAWLAAMGEVEPELERLMKQKPKHPRGEGYKP